MSRLTLELINQATVNASKKHASKQETIKFIQDKENEYNIYRQLLNGQLANVRYRYKNIVSPNGKNRTVAISEFKDRVIMHTLMLMMKPEYSSRLSDDCYNCIKGRGINSKQGRYNPVRQVKRIINMYHPWDIYSLTLKSVMSVPIRTFCFPVMKRSGKISDF